MTYPILLQPAPEADSGAAPASGAGPFGSTSMIFIMIAVMVGMLFMTTRAEGNRQKETDKFIKGLERGMKVRTSSGILGEIISVGERDVVLGIAEKVRINVLKSHLSSVEPEAKEAEKK